MKFGVIGAGAIGLTFAAALAPVHDVIVLARRAAVAETIAREGIVIERDGRATSVAVAATVEPRELADRDAVLIAVKAYATGSALAPLRGVVAARALFLSIQNGIDNVADAERALPGARVVGGSTLQGAILLEPGRVRAVNSGLTTVGRSTGGRPSSEEVVAAFGAAELDAKVSGDIARVLWRKLIVNAAINPLGALTGAANGTVVEDTDLRGLARDLAREAATVAAAEGIAIPDWWEAVATAAQATASNRNSMLQDLSCGRRTEIEAISGAIVRRAARHGIAVPFTETMLRLVRARERS